MKLTLVTSPEGDWQVWYRDDELIYEGDGLRAKDLARLLNIPVKHTSISDELMEMMSFCSPKSLSTCQCSELKDQAGICWSCHIKEGCDLSSFET